MHPGGRSCWAVAIALAFAACSSRASQAAADGSIEPAVDAAMADAAIDAAVDGPEVPADADCTCAIAPAPRCADATTLVTSRAPGTCADHSACTFETFASPCTFGCADGACQPAACVPVCPTQACGDDGCGGSCGACPVDTTVPGVTPVQLGIARDAEVAPDGIHVATLRARERSCDALELGTLDVWTVPVTGAATHRIVGAHAPATLARFTDDGHLVYSEVTDAMCTTGVLWVASADGSNPVALARDVSPFPTVVGPWIYYSARAPAPASGFAKYVARLPAGAPHLVATLAPDDFDEVSPTGDALWVMGSYPAADLVLYRADGGATVLVDAPLSAGGLPTWSQDGKRLAYTSYDRRTNKDSLFVADVAGGPPALLDDDCQCAGFDSVAFSPDGARIAWLHSSARLNELDAQIHRFAGGADVRLTSVVSPVLGGPVIRFTFSADSARLYAAVGDDTFGFRLASGPVDVTTAAVSLGSLLPDGDRFQGSWDETLDGAAIAFSGGDHATHVVTAGVGARAIPGDSFERPRFEHVATAPRLLAMQSDKLGVFPTSGAGPGTPLPGFDWTTQLSPWVFAGNIPFAFGWSGPVALYPAALNGSSAFAVIQDLMAWTPTAQGRLAARVIRYRLADATARIFAITQDQALFAIPRP
jgi:WD40-like Beta Propeller Repeat